MWSFRGRGSSMAVRKRCPQRKGIRFSPLSPYGVNKYACELYLDLYARLYGLSYAVARLTNPYGPSLDKAAKEYNVFNRLIATAAAGGVLTIYGDGKTASGLRVCRRRDRGAGSARTLDDDVVANVGSGRALSLREAAQTVVRIAGRGSIEHVDWPQAAERVETGDFFADISRMRALGWSPAVMLDEGIRRTLESVRSVT